MQSLAKALRVLFVYPDSKPSYWGFEEGLPAIWACSSMAPLPAITVAALLPQDWQMKLVDLKFQELTDADLEWADVVFVTGMIIHKESMLRILERCRAFGVATIVGGPFATSAPDAPELATATSVFLGEAEGSLALEQLVADLRAGTLKGRYVAVGYRPMTESPVPRFDLLQATVGKYAAMTIQVSRGCPHACEFCYVRKLNGQYPRYKEPSQVVQELQAIYDIGHRGNVFVVDDNFIGNLKKAPEIVEAMRVWNESLGMPFQFYTQGDVRLVDHPDLIEAMVRAGFFALFVGLETPSRAALAETHKNQNLKMDLVEAVRILRSKGLLVYAGLIVGFDSDGPDCFETMLNFVTEAGIDFAMVGMLSAIPDTDLYKRLQKEGRLLADMSGDQFEASNMAPKSMTRLEFTRGYRQLLEQLYTPEAFFARTWHAVQEWVIGPRRQVTLREVNAVFWSFWVQGIRSSYRRQYWRFMWRTFRNNPQKVPRAFAMAISGHHFFILTGILSKELRRLESALYIEERERSGDPISLVKA